MEIRKGLELVNVDYENNGAKAVMTFLDKERKEVRTVNFNTQVFRDGSFQEDADKKQKVEEWCKEYFGTSFKKLGDCIGQKKDVYIYDRFNSLFPVDIVEKFTSDMAGQIFQTSVKEIILDDYFIKIRYEIEGKTYESKQTFGTYIKDMNSWYVDPQKKDREFDKFKEKYGVSVEDRDQLIGHPLMVEVKTAFGTNLWGDIKRFPQK